MSGLGLTGAQRKFLRGRAHELKPLVQIGRHGASEPLLAELGRALDQHELVKVRFLDHQDEMKAVCAEIDAALGCETVGRIGHVAIVFRPAGDVERRRIQLPGSASGDASRS